MWNKAPLLDNTPCAIQSLDNMSIDPVCDDGDDDDDDGDDDDDYQVEIEFDDDDVNHLYSPIYLRVR